METKGFVFNLKSADISSAALSASFEYLCYGFVAIKHISLFQCRYRFETSESDVYRRQILTSKVGPRVERVKLSRRLSNYYTGIDHKPILPSEVRHADHRQQTTDNRQH